MMPDTGSVVVEEQELLVGKEAFARVEAAVAAVDVSGLRVPRTSRAAMVRVILARLVVLEGELAGILEELSARRGAALKAAVATLPDLCRAMLYAQARYRTALAETDDAEQERFIEIVRRWRAPSMRLMGQLVELGHVDPKVAAHIRSGRGNDDLADDAVEMSPLFDERWGVVEQLQSIQTDPAQRLTRADLAAHQSAALKYLEARKADDAHLPVEARRRRWADASAALQQLIDAQWDEVRLDAEFAFKHQRRAPEAFTDLVSTTALMLREG
jgi:hypothetical protein